MDKIYCYNCFQEKNNAEEVCPACGYSPGQDKDKYPLALPHGTVLNGRYILGRVLGQGGFGITYVAQDWKGGGIVAVKEYLPDSMAVRAGSYTVTAYSGQQEEGFRYGKECFLNEAKTLAEFLGNPNVVQVHSYFEENGTAYFVMDYVEGISLQKYIQNQGGKIGWQKAEEILLPVMDALAAVHSRGVIHRDVTPDNIYITGNGTVKLLDFGAARYSMGDKSRSLDIVLKHGFAPKEQYTRRGRQGPYTDVYSLAATYYYALTGRKPQDSIDRMDEDDLLSFGSLGVSVPEYVEDAIFKGLAVQPSDRFQSMGEFKRALTNGEAGTAPQPAVSIEFGQPVSTSQNVQTPQDAAMPQSGSTPQSVQIPQPVSASQSVAAPRTEETTDQVAGMGKPGKKWLIPAVCCAAGVLVTAVVAAIAVNVAGDRKAESKAMQQTSTKTVADEREFINLDEWAKEGDLEGQEENNAEQEDVAAESDDSYDTLFGIFADHAMDGTEAYFIYDDFDCNGTYEAFGITGTPDEYGIYDGVNIHFVDSSGNWENVTPVNNMREDFWGYLGEETLDTGNGKFIVWELYANGSGSLSYILGVRDGAVYEPDISRTCEWFTYAEYRDYYYALTNDFSQGWHDYVSLYYVFDADTGQFLQTENPWEQAGSKQSGRIRYYHGVAFYEDYVLPYSSEHYCNIRELSDLNLEQLKIARNEIYARHGRRFQDEELQAYFDSCGWYVGTIAPEDFNQEKVFNEYEKENVLRIKEYEEQLGD